jgi:hypothetical protein
LSDFALDLGFALGVNGLGGVFSIRRRTSSLVGVSDMAELSLHTALLASLLQRDPKKEAAYYEELGRFIAAYSSAEAQIHVLARAYSKTDDDRARIMLGGLRLVDIIERLRALMRIPDGDGRGYWVAFPQA